MPSSPKLLWLNVGQPADLALPRRTIRSAIVKTPVDAAVELTETGLRGDRQADLTVHGGPDKAVCVYAAEHYPYWQHRLQLPLEPGAFGENFTTSGLVESEVCIGDIYSAAHAVVQVTQPRQPCFRLAARHEKPELPKWVVETGFSGFYFRTLQPGAVEPGAELILLERPAPGVTVSLANAVLYSRRAHARDLRAVLQAPGLAADMRSALEARLPRAG